MISQTQSSHASEDVADTAIQRGPTTAGNKSTTHRTHTTHRHACVSQSLSDFAQILCIYIEMTESRVHFPNIYRVTCRKGSRKTLLPCGMPCHPNGALVLQNVTNSTMPATMGNTHESYAKNDPCLQSEVPSIPSLSPNNMVTVTVTILDIRSQAKHPPMCTVCVCASTCSCVCIYMCMSASICTPVHMVVSRSLSP